MVLVEVTECKEQKSNKAGVKETDEYLEFVTWGLVWDGIENRLKRRVAVFHLRPFAGLKMVNSLPVYPVHYGQDNLDDFMSDLARRGRKWLKLIAARTSCLKYNGLAYSSEPTTARRAGRESKGSKT